MRACSNHTTQRIRAAVYVSQNPSALGGWLAPLMVIVGPLDDPVRTSTHLYILSFLTTIYFMVAGCSNETFKLRVENVFYIKTIDRVIVTGSVSSGTVKAGDHLVVRSGNRAIPVTVECLEHPKLKLESASKGQPVGLVLIGLNKDQVRDGDSVETP